jgi:hypothetical protein
MSAVAEVDFAAVPGRDNFFLDCFSGIESRRLYRRLKRMWLARTAFFSSIADHP